MRTKTPNLFDVPKDRPTAKERMEAFKAKHGIWTYHSPHMKRKEMPWEALWLTKAIEVLAGYGVKATDHPVEIIAGYSRLLDEMNLLIEGQTESTAVERLCAVNNIRFDL